MSKRKSVWTQFHDMHSGGGLKEPPYGRIYIEASENEARAIFYNRFGHNPDRVSCTCCGEDYSISEYVSLAQASGFERNCRNLVTPQDSSGLYVKPKDASFDEHYYLEDGEAPPKGYEIDKTGWKTGKYETLAEYVKHSDVLVIYAKDIKPSERAAEIPEQGYVWVD